MSEEVIYWVVHNKRGIMAGPYCDYEAAIDEIEKQLYTANNYSIGKQVIELSLKPYEEIGK